MRITGTVAEKGMTVFANENHVHAGHVMPRIWILVADRKEARIFRKTKDGIEQIGYAMPEHPPGDGKTRTGSSGAGNSLNSYGKQDHHYDREFVKSLSRWLEEAADEKAFDRIAIIAAPIFLSEIRSVFSSRLQERVIAEVNKELTGMCQKDIEAHLEKMAWY